jgi:hypothetical protein
MDASVVLRKQSDPHEDYGGDANRDHQSQEPRQPFVDGFLRNRHT